MTVTDAPTACITYSNVFLNPLLEDPARTGGNRREHAMLQNQASNLCAECPLQAKCLTDAVTKFEVSGFAGGTTRRQREEIRARLGIQLADDDLDTWAGVNSSRSYDGEEILRLREANPTEPLKFIAARMGCSVSTVKRHLRRLSREEVPAISATERPLPSQDEVMAVAAEVCGQGVTRSAAA